MTELPFSKERQLSRGPKRTARHKATKTEWARIVEAKQGPCRVCLFVDEFPKEAAEMGLTRCGYRVSYHHIVDRGGPHFGDDVADNIAPLGGSGTTGHHGDVTARRVAACAAFVVMLTDEEKAYGVGRGGPAFFVRKYGVAE